MGVELTDPSHERVPSFTLGVPSTSPLEMAEAYATFAGRGLHCDSRPVTAIEDSAGNLLKQYPSKCQQVVPASVADAVNDVLRGVQEPGGFGYDAGISLNQPSAGKTGTINDNMAVWFDGYTPNLSTVSMIAGANSVGHWVTLNGQSLKGGYVATAHGSTTAGPMWGDAMKVIQQWLPDTDFVKPSAKDVAGVQTPVPDTAGMSMDQAQKVLEDAGFQTMPGGYRDSAQPLDTVAYTSPAAGSLYGSGSTVTIYQSTGHPPVQHHSSGGGGGGHSGGGGGKPGGGGGKPGHGGAHGGH
jgi:membrane peptidoglycan carboxypeptidase